MKQKRKSYIVILAILILLVVGITYIVNKKTNRVISENNNNLENQSSNVISAVEHFVLSIRNKDYQKFKQVTSKSGLIIIRNFVTGEGTRGKNIRDYYLVDKIPSDLIFPVRGEIPIDPSNLFKGTLEGNINKIPIKMLKGIHFNFQDNSEPATFRIREICTEIRSGEFEDDLSPRIYVLGDNEFVLTESDITLGLPTGSWAIFEKVYEEYLLRAIVDFR